MAEVETYYRVEASSGDIFVTEMPVVKRTPRGVWVDVPFSGRRFVLKSARKRFACPTLEEAIDSFLARKRRQLKILTAQINRVEAWLAAGTEHRQELLRNRRVDVPRPLLSLTERKTGGPQA